MIRRMECYEKHDWQGLIEDRLEPSEATKLTRHLDTCHQCRATLEQIAAPKDMWTGTIAALSDNLNYPEGGEVGLNDQLLSQLQSEILSPTSDPNYLGMLDHYLVKRVVGSGGMGIVAEAFDPTLHRTVAIKLLHPHLSAMGIARQRFAREARAAAAVVHPNVVAIHAVVADAKIPYLVMAFVLGESLQDRIDQQGSLPLNDCVRIATQVAEGLAAAHAQGLVHRDIKPANILLEKGTNRVWLTDFGLARTLDDATMTASGFIAGTPQFMSPEQANGDSVDHRSDLFSLGSVIYTMIAGRPPFRAESSIAVLRRIADHRPRRLQEITQSVPLWLEAMVAKLHEKPVDARYQSASELAGLLSKVALHLDAPHQFALPNSIQQIMKEWKAKLKRNRVQGYLSWRNAQNEIGKLLRSRIFQSSLAVSIALASVALANVYLNNTHSDGKTTWNGANRYPTTPVSQSQLIQPSPSPIPSTQSISTEWYSQDINPFDLESRIQQINQPFFPGIKEPIDDEK